MSYQEKNAFDIYEASQCNDWEKSLIQKYIDELEFISTFEVGKKPSFQTRIADCSSLYNKILKLNKGDSRNTTYNTIYELLKGVGEIFQTIEKTDTLYSDLYIACQNAKEGLKRLAQTYPLKGYQRLDESLDTILKSYAI